MKRLTRLSLFAGTAICDNCQTEAPLGSILVDVTKHMDLGNDIPQSGVLTVCEAQEKNENAENSATRIATKMQWWNTTVGVYYQTKPQL